MLVAGEVDLMFAGLGSVAPHIASGRLRALASTSAKPSALAPQLPTVAATLPGYEAETLIGIFAPAKTPAVIVARLHQELVKALNRAEVKQRLGELGIEVVANTPDEYLASMKNDIARTTKLIKDAGIRVE